MTWLADTTTRAWIYNIELASWVEEKSKPEKRDSAANGDVSMLFPPFQHNGKSAKELYAVWCPKHRRYESLASTGKIQIYAPFQTTRQCMKNLLV